MAALDSTLWAVATSGDEHRLFRLAGDGQSWIGSANLKSGLPIYADINGSVWQVERGALRKVDDRKDAELIVLKFKPLDVSFGSDGTLWALGGERRFGGSVVWRFSASEGQWLQLPAPAAAIRICGAPDGAAWTINSRGDLWRLHPDGAGSFNECGLNPDCRNCLYSADSGMMRDLSVDGNGTVWFVTPKDDKFDIVGVIADFDKRRSRRIALTPRLRSITAARVPAASIDR